ncbi:hypothetical protein H4R19_005170, partial [Coemansia spiralis]
MYAPPSRNDGPYPPQAGYSSTYHGGGVAPPPMAHQQSSGPNANTYAARAERYTPPQAPTAMSQSMSQYQPEGGGGQRPGRMSTAYGQTPNASRVYDDRQHHRHRSKNHYGHLVNDDSHTAAPCSGLAWKGCCKYNETAREYLEKAAAPFEVFDRRAKLLQRNRAAGRVADSRDVDYVRDEVAARVADRLLDIKRRYHTVVELGAGSGHLAKAVDSDMMDQLIMCEMSPQMLNRDKDAQYDVAVERRVMDEEMPQFADASLDAVISSLAMHWVNDLPGMLIQIRRALVPDGVFIGAMLGGDSLFELRSSLLLADTERDGGVAARVSPLTDTRD